MITETGLVILRETRNMSDFQDFACELMEAERYVKFVSCGDVGMSDVIAEVERLKRQQDEDAGIVEQREMFLGTEAAAQCHA